MADRRISKRLKGKVMSTCHTSMPVRNGNFVTVKLQQQRRQNNWIRNITRLTGADMRIMVELREETGVQRRLTERLVRSKLQWGWTRRKDGG